MRTEFCEEIRIYFLYPRHDIIATTSANTTYALIKHNEMQLELRRISAALQHLHVKVTLSSDMEHPT